MNTRYISVDIEADGPIPGDNSMLAIGAAAFEESGELVGTVPTFSVNLAMLPNAMPDSKTMKFWSRNPGAWDAHRRDIEPPGEAMRKFSVWLTLQQKPDYSLTFVGYPAPYDFMFVHWYFHHFLKRDPFGFVALDLKTYAMAVLDTEFKGTTKKNMPPAWFKGLPKHTHVAVEDALEQGYLFFKMREKNRAAKILRSSDLSR